MPLQTFPTINPDYVYEVGTEWKTTVNTMGDGTEERVQQWVSAKRVWTLNFSSLSVTDMGTLNSFFAARKGSFEAFYWTCKIDSVQYTVRFVEDKLVPKRLNNFRYSLSFSLITCNG